MQKLRFQWLIQNPPGRSGWDKASAQDCGVRGRPLNPIALTARSLCTQPVTQPQSEASLQGQAVRPVRSSPGLAAQPWDWGTWSQFNATISLPVFPTHSGLTCLPWCYLFCQEEEEAGFFQIEHLQEEGSVCAMCPRNTTLAQRSNGRARGAHRAKVQRCSETSPSTTSLHTPQTGGCKTRGPDTSLWSNKFIARFGRNKCFNKNQESREG